MEIIIVAKNIEMRIVKAPRCTIDGIPRKRSQRIWNTSIIPNKDIPNINRFGPQTIRPLGSRQPLVEMRVIARIVMAVNNMSVFSST